MECFLEEPEFILVSSRVANRRMNNCSFILWKHTITERISDVALFESTTMFDSKAEEISKGISVKYRSEAF